MQILLTGGGEALQHSVTEGCVAAGHSVRVMATTSGATKPWPPAVEPMTAESSSPDALRQAAAGCEAVIAISPALSPSLPPAAIWTLERILEAAGHADVSRLIIVTSLDDRSAERAARPLRRASGLSMDSLVIRTALPYGTTDDPLTLFVILMRSLPAVPLLRPSLVARPVWHEDLSRCIATGVALPAHKMNRIVTVAGNEAVTEDELYERLADLIDRRPTRIPVPYFLATFGRRVADALGLPMAHVPGRFGWLPSVGASADDGADGECAAAIRTPLDEGLRRLIRELAEVTPDEGVGTLQVKTFGTVIQGPKHDAAELMSVFRARFADIMPVEVGVEPAAPAEALTLGSVMTMALPGRGHVQIRVVDVQPTETTIATLRGHTVAGIVRFSASSTARGLRFEVMTCDRAANFADWVGLTLGGSRLQDANWTTVVKNVADLSGGRAPNVRVESRRLSATEAQQAERWIARLLRHRDVPTTSHDEAPTGDRGG